MKKKREVTPRRKIGKHTGFDLHEDGSISVAPMYSNRMNDLADQEEGVNRMLRAITKHASETLTTIIKQRQELFKTIADDYGLDLINDRYVMTADKLTRVKDEATKGK